MPVLEVKTIEPFAMSPDDAAALLSVNKRTVYRLITGKKLIARKSGSRTLVDYQSVKAHYNSLPLISGASIPNAPQRCRRTTRLGKAVQS
jgi:excisionase family DNA binding protein